MTDELDAQRESKWMIKTTLEEVSLLDDDERRGSQLDHRGRHFDLAKYFLAFTVLLPSNTLPHNLDTEYHAIGILYLPEVVGTTASH